MELADQLTILGLLMFPPISGFIWGRWERMGSDVLEEIVK